VDVALKRWPASLRASALACALAAQLGCPALSARLLPNPMVSAAAANGPKVEPVDVAQLRSRYSESPELRERCDSERPLDQAFAQLEASQWSALQGLTASWLERCPIDIDFHRLRARTLFVLGRTQESGEHMRRYRELLAAALESGDGASPESAYVVVTRSEEQALMRALELTPLRQVWVSDGLHGFEVQNAVGRTSTIYFNPSTRMSRLLREAPLEDEP
jgi:hypothetical protein